MLQFIYGLAGTGKTRYALHDAYLSNKHTAVFMFDVSYDYAVDTIKKMYNTDKFYVYDCTNVTCETLIDVINSLDKKYKNIIIDSFSMMDSTERDSDGFHYTLGTSLSLCMKELMKLKKNVTVIEYQYLNLVTNKYKTVSESEYHIAPDVKNAIAFESHKISNDTYFANFTTFKIDTDGNVISWIKRV